MVVYVAYVPGIYSRFASDPILHIKYSSERELKLWLLSITISCIIDRVHKLIMSNFVVASCYLDNNLSIETNQYHGVSCIPRCGPPLRSVHTPLVL